MAFRNMRVALALAAMIVSPFLLVGGTQAQGSCSQTFDQIERNNRAFEEEAKKQSADFLVDDTVDTAISGAQKLLKTTTTPTRGSASQMETYKTKIETWEKVQETFGVTLKDLEKCLLPGSGCSLVEFVGKQNEAFKRWLQTFLGDGTSAALERVRTAQSLVQSNVKQLAGNAMGSVAAAAKCIGDYQQRAQANDPVDPRAPQTTSAPKEGMGAGTKVLMAGGVAGAAVAGVLAYQSFKSAVDDIGGSGGGSDGGGASVTYRVQATRTCTQGSFPGGIPGSCTSAFALPCGSPTDFPVTVTNGTLTDTCGWLSTASVASGSYSGRYFGQGNGVVVTGPFNPAGNSTLTGNGQYEGGGNTSVDHVTLTVTRQ